MKADIILRNAEALFNFWHEDSKHPQGHVPDWNIQPEWIKVNFYIWAKSSSPYKNKSYYFCQPQHNWQPYIASQHKLDWKDYRMSVCKTHTWYDESENLYQVIAGFEAWLDQEVYCIKDYQPSGYFNHKDNIYEFKVIKVDGLSGRKTSTFHEYKKALEYARTCSIQDAKCQNVVFTIYLKNKLLYTICARKKSPMVKKKNEPVAEQEEEERDAEVINHPKLSLMQGGKDGNVNWLKALPVNTIFLAKKRGDTEFVCHQFVLDWKGKRGALLTSNLPSKAEVPVDMLVFSMLHECVEIQRLGFEDINE